MAHLEEMVNVTIILFVRKMLCEGWIEVSVNGLEKSFDHSDKSSCS